jgi:hypothetical protein
MRPRGGARNATSKGKARDEQMLIASFLTGHIVLFICLSSARQLKCFRVSKTESFGISRICFEMTRQATMPSSSAEVSSRIQNRELRSQEDLF